MKIERKTILALILPLLLLSLTIPVILALERAPPYANAKVSTFKWADPPWFAYADAKAKALPGYGYAYVYAYVYTTPAARSSTAYAEVEFNANPVPGNSPVLDWFFYIMGSTTIYVKGTVESQEALAARLNIGFQIYDYKQGKWVPDPY